MCVSSSWLGQRRRPTGEFGFFLSPPASESLFYLPSLLPLEGAKDIDYICIFFSLYRPFEHFLRELL